MPLLSLFIGLHINLPEHTSFSLPIIRMLKITPCEETKPTTLHCIQNKDSELIIWHLSTCFIVREARVRPRCFFLNVYTSLLQFLSPSLLPVPSSPPLSPRSSPPLFPFKKGEACQGHQPTTALYQKAEQGKPGEGKQSPKQAKESEAAPTNTVRHPT